MNENWTRCAVRAAGLLAAGTLLTATKLCETGRLSNLPYALLAALCLGCLGLLVHVRARQTRYLRARPQKWRIARKGRREDAG